MLLLSAFLASIPLGLSAPPPGPSAFPAPFGPTDLPQDGVPQALQDLSDPSAARRNGAERWLATHLTAADGPRLAQLVLLGEPEVSHRIVRAVGEADRRLALTLTFLVDPRAEVRELGEAALRIRIARWNERVAEHGLSGNALRFALLDTSRQSFPETLRLDLVGTLGEVCALLERRARIPVGLAVDPSVADRRASVGADGGAPHEIVGTWEEVVRALASHYRVGLEGHGFQTGDEAPGPSAFLRFCPPVEEGLRDTGEVLASWCRTVAKARGDGRRTAAARALAGCGWPEGLEWLVDRAFDAPPSPDATLPAEAPTIQDDSALSALLAAAAEGRVPSFLERPGTIRLLVELATRPPESQQVLNRSMAIVDALSRLPNLTIEGEITTARVVLMGQRSSDAFGLWVRLAILEGIGAPEGSGPALAVLADRGAPADLVLQALRTLRASRAGIARPQKAAEAGDPVLLQPNRILGLAQDVSESVDLARLLAATGVRPSEEVPVDADKPLAGTTLLLVELLRGDAERASRLWLDLAKTDDGELVARTLRALGPGELDPTVVVSAWRSARRRALEDAGGGGPRAAVDRSALLAGIVPAGEIEELSRARLEAGPGVDLALLSVLAGRPAGGVAREARLRLTELLRQALERGDGIEEARPLLLALEGAMQDLRSEELLPSASSGAGNLSSAPGGKALDRAQPLVELWRRQVRSMLLLRSSRAPGDSGRGGAPRSGGLAAELGPGWPPPRPPRVVDLDALDRRLGEDRAWATGRFHR